MLSVRWQRAPLSGAGATTSGGRWNRTGQAALYLSADHGTAVAEFHQSLVRPGTLVGYDVHADMIADLTSPAIFDRFSADPAIAGCEWRKIAMIDRVEPPTWALADQLADAGAQGVLFPSQQQAGGVNLVLWRWSSAPGDGAMVHTVDPTGDLAA